MEILKSRTNISDSSEKIKRILERAERSIEKAKKVRDISIGRPSKENRLKGAKGEGSHERSFSNLLKSKTCTNSPSVATLTNKENRNKVSSYLYELRKKMNCTQSSLLSSVK